MGFASYQQVNDVEINGLIRLLSSSKDTITRIKAADALGKIGNERGVDALINALNDKDSAVRWRAAHALGNIGNDWVIDVLINALKDYNSDVRSSAADALVKICSERVIDALINALNDQDSEVRWRAADALGKIGSERTIDALINALNDQDLYVRITATDALVKIGRERAVDALINALNDQDSSVRSTATDALVKICSERTVDALINALNNKDSNVRISAASALGRIGSENAVGTLINALNDEDSSVRSTVVFALGKIRSENAVDALINALKHKDLSVRSSAAVALVKIGVGNPEVIKALIQLLSTSNSYSIRRKTVELLQKIAIGNLEAIEKIRILRHTTESAYIRHLATEVLEVIDSAHDKQTQEQDDLLLFLQTTRIQETVDTYLFNNNHQKTKFCYQRIIACLDKLQAGRDILTRRSLINSYLEIYQKIVAFAINTRDFKTALLYAEILRNCYLVERISQQELPLPATITPQLAESINQAKRTEKWRLQEYTNGIYKKLSEQQLEQLDQKWVEAKQALEKLYAQVATTEPEFIAKTKISPITYQEIQSLLSPDTAILEFFFTDKELVTMVILPGEASPIIPKSLSLPLKQAPLNNLELIAQTLVAELATKNKKNKDNLEHQIQQIPQIIDQISDILKSRDLLNFIPPNIQHLIIIPHHYLHLFPIHSLWLNHYQRLIDRFSVSYFPNLQIWKICQNRQRYQTTLIGIENPTQDKDLIFVKAEVASINQRQKFKQKQILTGQQASKTNIFNLAASNHCFHFSGHAEYNFENPLESYLMLSENTSDNLTLNSIFTDLHMPHADLVALSACCTGLVDAFQPAEEYLGLATGFLLAGAKAVIGSQWKVNSIATAFLFDEFYRQLEIVNHKSIALKNAQNWLRNCTAEELRERAKNWDLSTLEPKEKFRLDRALKRLRNVPFENPYYWAGFILTGC